MENKRNFESVDKFTLQSVTVDKLSKEIFNLDDSKATQYGDGIMRTRIIPNTDTFHAVWFSKNFLIIFEKLSEKLQT